MKINLNIGIGDLCFLYIRKRNTNNSIVKPLMFAFAYLKRYLSVYICLSQNYIGSIIHAMQLRTLFAKFLADIAYKS